MYSDMKKNYTYVPMQIIFTNITKNRFFFAAEPFVQHDPKLENILQIAIQTIFGVNKYYFILQLLISFQVHSNRSLSTRKEIFFRVICICTYSQVYIFFYLNRLYVCIIQSWLILYYREHMQFPEAKVNPVKLVRILHQALDLPKWKQKNIHQLLLVVPQMTVF